MTNPRWAVPIVSMGVLLAACVAGGSGDSVRFGADGDTGLAIDAATSADRVAIVDVPGGRLAVELADHRTVQVQRGTEAGWTEPRTIATFDDRECGRVSAVAAGDGLAVKVACDTGWNEEEPPGRSVALVSADVTGERATWDRHDIEGETFTSGPGISPDGKHAVWTQDEEHRVLTWSSDGGFSDDDLDLDTDNGASAATIDDSGRVTGFVVGGPPRDLDDAGGVCTVRLVGAVVQDLEISQVTDGCPDPWMRVTGGGTVDLSLGDEASTFELGRDGSRWKVTRVAPAYTPGLKKVAGEHGEIATTLAELTDGTWVAVSSSDRQHVVAQRLAPGDGRWTEPAVVHDHGFGGCTTGPSQVREVAGPADVLGFSITCYAAERADGRYPALDDDFIALPHDGQVLLVTVDGRVWSTVSTGAHVGVFSPDGRWIVAPGSTWTLFSAQGRTEVARDVNRCDLPVAWTGGTLLRFTGGSARSRHYPTRLESLDVDAVASGAKVAWTPVRDIDVDLPKAACEAATDGSDPGRFVTGQFEAGGDWTLLSTTRQKDGSWRPVTRE